MYRTSDLLTNYKELPINKFILSSENNKKVIVFSINPVNDPIPCEILTIQHCNISKLVYADEIVGFTFEIIGNPKIRFTELNVTLLTKNCSMNNIAESSLIKLYEYKKLNIYSIYESTIITILPSIYKVDY